MGRAPCCDKANVKKGPWLPEEDAALKSYIEEHGPVGNWITLPQKIGLRRCGKSCRLRWLNYLRPNLKHGGFSEEEDDIICSLYINIGSRWSIIAAQLPGRTDNDIKNYWNTKLKKKLLGKQRSKEHHVRIDGSKRERTNVSSGDDNFSVISGSTNAWPEVPQGVNSLPLATMSQSPNLITDQASLVALPVQLGGRSSPTQEQEPVLTNTYFPQYPNDMIPTPSHYPFEYTAFTSSQPQVDSITHALMTQYNINMDKAPALLNNELQEFSLGEIEYHGLLDLLDVPNTGNIYGTHEMANGSVCSSAPCSGARSNATWEEISYLLAESTACPPLLCEYEAHSQSLGGGGGLEDCPFEGSRL